MTVPRILVASHAVQRELEELTEAQRSVVFYGDSSVVRAGPGSGKTRTLVAKAAWLADVEVAWPQRIACITYSVAAAQEIRQRVRRLAPQYASRIYCGTVHGFCFTQILMPFGHLVGRPVNRVGAVISEEQSLKLLFSMYQRAGVPEQDPQWNVGRDTALRRALALGEDVSSKDQRLLRAMRLYDEYLADHLLVDFEAMVIQALKLVKESPALARMVYARYPWVVVDEYQDLGGVLHSLVVQLHKSAKTKVFAVGDTDQCVYQFNGAHPRYFESLSRDIPGIKQFRLVTNFRSAGELVQAAAAALGVNRGYIAFDQESRGAIDRVPIKGTLQEQAAAAVRIAQGLIERGADKNEVAVLYRINRKKHPIRRWLQEAMTSSKVPSLIERANDYPRSEIVSFLMASAAFALGHDSGTFGRVSLNDLLERWTAIRGLTDRSRLETRTNLYRALAIPCWPTEPFPDWVARFSSALQLAEVAALAVDESYPKALGSLLNDAQWRTVPLAEFGGVTELLDKVVVTTFHAAKAREWEHVILVGLQEGLSPAWSLDFGKGVPPSPAQVDEERLLFYVAFTRAKKSVSLIYTDDKGPLQYAVSPSRFLQDLP